MAQSQQFGTGVILSIGAITAFAAAKQDKYLADLWNQMMQESELAQTEQGTLTNTLAQDSYNTIYDQYKNEDQTATATFVQGGVGIAAPVGAGLFELSNASSKLSSMPDLIKAKTNTANARTALDQGGVDARVGAPLGGKQFTKQDLQALQLADFSKGTEVDPDLHAKLQQLGARGAASNPDADFAENRDLGEAYKNVASRIKDQDKAAQKAVDTKQAQIDKRSSRIEHIGSGLQYAMASQWQLAAAQWQLDKAGDQQQQTYAQFMNDTTSQNVQTQQKTASGIVDDLREVMRNTISGLANANSPA